MTKANVCIIRSNPVNPDSRVEKEAKSLQKDGYNVQVLAWDRESDYAAKKELIKLDGAEIPITRIGCKASYGDGMKNIFPYLKFQMSMRLWLKKNIKTIDVIHACDFDTAFFSMGVAKSKKKLFVFDIFDFLHSKPTDFFQNIVCRTQKKIIDKANGTIICTEDRVNQIKGSKPKKLAIIHNSPECQINEEKASENKTDDFVVVVYVGILQDYRLLKEVTEVIEKKPNVKFKVAGFGKYENFFQEISEKYDNIEFLGRINYSKTISLESKSDIMLAIYDPAIDNHVYAAPNKFYESLMLGKPVIMVKNTGMSSFVSSENIGELIDYSSEGFDQGLDRLIQRKNEWPEMSKRMKKLYNDQFSWVKMEQRLLTFYDELIKENV